MVTYGSGLGKDHDHDNLPLVVTGRGNGLFTLGPRMCSTPRTRHSPTFTWR